MNHVNQHVMNGYGHGHDTGHGHGQKEELFMKKKRENKEIWRKTHKNKQPTV